MSEQAAVASKGYEMVNVGADGTQVTNPNYKYANDIEHYQGFLSKQFPATANPAPLGLCCFGLSAFVLGMVNAGGLVSIHTDGGIIMGLALCYGGIVQLCAGMWEFKTGNTIGALFFASYAGFWMSYAALFMKCFGFLNGYFTYAAGPKDLHDGLGLYLTAWAMFSAFNVLALHRTTLGLVGLLSFVTLAILLLAIHYFTIDSHPTISINCQEAGGVFGVLAGLLAWYCAFSALLTKKNSFILLPVFPLDPIWKAWGMLPEDRERGF